MWSSKKPYHWHTDGQEDVKIEVPPLSAEAFGVYCFWEPKSNRNPLQNRIQNGRHREIDFYQVSETFGRQFGVGHPVTLNPQREQQKQ